MLRDTPTTEWPLFTGLSGLLHIASLWIFPVPDRHHLRSIVDRRAYPDFGGDTLLSRQGASLLSAAGLADWVATNKDDYVAKAISFAFDLMRLAALRAGLRQQELVSPLFETPRFARNFEDALWGMWRAKTQAEYQSTAK